MQPPFVFTDCLELFEYFISSLTCARVGWTIILIHTRLKLTWKTQNTKNSEKLISITLDWLFLRLFWTILLDQKRNLFCLFIRVFSWTRPYESNGTPSVNSTGPTFSLISFTSNIFIFDLSNLVFIWDKWYHLTVCLHLIEPNWMVNTFVAALDKYMWAKNL